MKNGCEFAIRKTRLKKALKNQIWERLGLHLGGFGGGFGRDLEALGASWVVFGALFLMLVLGVVFQHALGDILAGLWLDFNGLGKGFGRVLGGFWAEFPSILGDSGLLWFFLGYWGVFHRFLFFLVWRAVAVLAACAFRSIAAQVLNWFSMAMDIFLQQTFFLTQNENAAGEENWVLGTLTLLFRSPKRFHRIMIWIPKQLDSGRAAFDSRALFFPSSKWVQTKNSSMRFA